MSQISRTVVLTGAYAGQTINLRGQYPFVNGRLTLTGEEHDVNCEVRVLEINFSAYLAGDPRLPQPKGAPDVLGHLPPSGTLPDGASNVQGGGVADGSGAPAGGDAGDGSVSGDASTGSEGGGADGNGLSAELKLAKTVTPDMSVDSTATPPKNPAAETLAALGPLAKAVMTPPKAEEPTTPADAKLARAVKKLDPKNDEHWTQGGLPALSAVATFYGNAGFTRADVEAASEGARRPPQ